MPAPSDRRYAQTHEWHKLQGDTVTLGISKFAVDELTDITYLEVTAKGRVKAGDALGEVESVKATSEIYTGVGGEIVAVNQEVVKDPSILNRDPYEKGWIVKIKVDDPKPLESLMAAEEYEKAHS